MRKLICLFMVWLGVSPCVAAIDAMTGPTYLRRTADDFGTWQRIDFRPVRGDLRRASEIKVAIETKGPSMQGLVRIPRGLASNFDTGRGMTAVDLINPSDETGGFAEIVALEIAFTQIASGQTFRVYAVQD